jgi:hypothetical protein
MLRYIQGVERTQGTFIGHAPCHHAAMANCQPKHLLADW